MNERADERSDDMNKDILPPKADGQTQKKQRKRSRIFKKRDILNITAENDIRYRAPLSCRYLKILAWFCIFLLQIASIMNLKEQFIGTPAASAVWRGILELLGSLGVPLLLVANYSSLLNGSQSYRMMIIKNTALSAAFALLYLYSYFHYFVGIVAISKGSREAAHSAINSGIREMTDGAGYINFNMFLDILVCTLIVFFISYRPKKLFQGKKIVWFRLFTLLPILYEIGCVAVKILATEGIIMLPMWTFPLLTTNPPLTFLVFIIAALYIKRREMYFIKNGRTHEDYQRFLKTNTNSFQFSILLSAVVIIVGIADLILVVAVTMIHAGITGEPLELASSTVISWGFGSAAQLLLIVPLFLLFSYNKTHKNILVDLLIPLAAVVMIIFAYLEGAFDILCSIMSKF